MSKDIFDESVYTLVEGIIGQAMKDYKWALKNKHYEEAKKYLVEVPQFFRGEWFRMMCNLDGNKILASVEDEVRREAGELDAK